MGPVWGVACVSRVCAACRVEIKRTKRELRGRKKWQLGWTAIKIIGQPRFGDGFSWPGRVVRMKCNNPTLVIWIKSNSNDNFTVASCHSCMTFQLNEIMEKT